MGGIYVWFQYWVVHIFCIYVLECNKKVVKNSLKMYAQKRNMIENFFRGAKSLVCDIGHVAGYGVVYWYSKACAAAGSSECAMVHQLAHDDAGRMGTALYDYIHDPNVRADVNYAISAAYHAQVNSDSVQSYLAGRIGLGV
ncbi:hypothetical protein BTJ40_10725 [Microbulbifer sp. A4B17]|uniref:hypothetical protein n=1 Tax=Microbulbifer sp. A4B17 TaxID=359370 RepID=UPI000D52CD03|nr:hypothetical protein [Microbulbifer sp. A4B17]AWF81253.1 hypothetical protein BTJ40_10725 [Microbulbifer sp. A4B17]